VKSKPSPGGYPAAAFFSLTTNASESRHQPDRCRASGLEGDGVGKAEDRRIL